MQKSLKILILAILGSIARPVFPQNKQYIIANIADFDSKKPVKGARVYNLNAKAGSVSNEKGKFFIWAKAGDSVRVTAKGYNNRTIIFNNVAKDSTFYLFNDPSYITQLDEVVVQGKKVEQMKREINELLLEAPQTNKFDASNLFTSNSSPTTVGAGISISAIYDYFSHSGKDHRQAGILEQQSKYKFYADWRLNAKLVGRLTGLTGIELSSFMDTLSLDYLYVLRASDFELNATILSYFEAYKRNNRK